ncbi:hypothetical protein FKW77_010304 [Venturia effusa]|uniref:glucokinase n=1 Tax=Venturia effusa TaxID=50376 RepID=A0A517L4G2_9PEZI|nr:hypothetical protein FKW77_010304 [Venturia effusa]
MPNFTSASQQPLPEHYTPPEPTTTPPRLPYSPHPSPQNELAPNIPDLSLFETKAHRRRRVSEPNVHGAITSNEDDDERVYTASQVRTILDWREKQRSASNSASLSVPQLVSVALVLLVLVAQFLLPWVKEHIGKSEDIRRARFEAVCPWSPFEDHWICASDLNKVENTVSDRKTRNTFERPVARNMALSAAAERVVKEFEYDGDAIRKGVKEFLKEMDEGLLTDGTHLSQIPTYVTAVPDGTEKGLYMAVDLGGTNFRVCAIQLHGNTTFSLTQSKTKIPPELMKAKTAKELFSFLAERIQAFLKEHHNDHYQSYTRRRKHGGEVSEEEIFNMGFTFSFPVNQIGINKGLLMRWTKGFDIEDAVGKDVCALLQTEIDALHLPVRVAALVNDTVGTLMARSYTSPGKTGTLLGAIFGTGTNGAFVEKLDRVSKLVKNKTADGSYDSSTGEMIVNTEWGSFDNDLSVLPNTPYDIALDAETPNPGIQMFEKRVSGMFLGEIFRRAIVALMEDESVPLFKDENSSLNELHSTTCIEPDSPLFKNWGVDSSFLSLAHGDSSLGLKTTRQALDKEFGINAASLEDAEAVKAIAGAVGRRAARLAAIAIGAIVINSGRLEPSVSTASATTEQKDGLSVKRGEGSSEVDEDDVIDVGVDGSLVEFYPGFEDLIREALREITEIGPEGEKKIRIGIAKDGSGVGAALIALVAGKVASPLEEIVSA